MHSKPVIFMVEDEDTVLSANLRILSRRGYQVDQASCAADAYQYLENHTPELLMIDIMLPDGSGYDICRRFRQKSENPVLFLTGKNSVEDKVEGLNLGGDYYLTKPYHVEELLAVVNRLLEREEKHVASEKITNVLKKGNLEFDPARNIVTLDGEQLMLTSKEQRLLFLFMTNEGKNFSAEELYEQVWNHKAMHDIRTVRKHIMNLRSKIKAGETDEYDIVTTYGKGYTFL